MMPDEIGKSSTPLFLSITTFLLLSTIVFLVTEYLFGDSKVQYTGLGNFDLHISAYWLILVSGMTVVSAVSVIIHFVILIRTEGKRLVDRKTKALLKSRDFFLRLFDDSPVPYLMVDGEGMITLPNKAALRLLKHTTEELLQYTFYQFHADAQLAESKQILERLTRGIPTMDIELEIKRENDENRWVILSVMPFKVMGGIGNGGVVTMLDITEQKKIDQVKTEFVSIASHQLRTPLTAMKWYGEMVLSGDDPLTAKQRKHIEKIYHGNERMIGLVNLLLSASRLELGTLTVDITNVNLQQITKTILEDLAHSIETRSLQIIENYDGDSTNYYTDKKLVTMILQNLISNAVKYTKENGFVKINLHFSNEQCIVIVEDNGVGIPSKQQDKVFTKMFRAENARLSDTDGTGLGLYIVNEAVKTLGGKIRFTSEENKGTMFEVTLPSGTQKGVSKN